MIVVIVISLDSGINDGIVAGSTHSRFKFAKDTIEARKQGIARGAEETVVLAFGGAASQSTGVLVTRKLRRRQLWKVNGP